ncbi:MULTISPECIES: Gfo/Idh/MocA family protein [Cyanophyceae]|jgi:predicted dehydrogenase|uniref:Gfo/Idh/MocA family oxidoreductase n=2 Tax=Cyanophyceae TaxID=3028117 RepID=A0ABX5F7R3_9CHRO|nr:MULTISPECIES: Gfo/Idh/MocA family oxidoreductase [Cyanophyceae]AFY29215.1 putative dehydrogenase [Cyanobium gracile PCC 6307]KAF0654311.1 dehydrogenase [Cyanobium sp. Copco_Reservoir_LC18]MCP9796153.1 Gfo/Idh/MocA family oxidoreductase [Cyanobium sp. Lug-B]MCP9935165.1 Gfo/Idh/MocA family oxidoreductase [Cyanobium sp. Candia 9D4]PSB37644.1 gfo/Idh/MocA family oxidoreductase [Aphanothece cf. minutissima CCALA 015]
MNPVRVGVIGIGNMGWHHARVLSLLRDAELVGVADPDEARGRLAVEQFDCRWFPAYEELLGEVEAVCIAVPTLLHHRVGMACLQAGVHVLIEKPIAATQEEAADLIGAAEAAGRLLQVGHIERFNPAFRELLRVVANEEVVVLEARRHSPNADRANDVSVVLDLMIHDIDLVLELAASPVVRLAAAGGRSSDGPIDYVNATLGFANGVVASLTASKMAHRKIRSLSAHCRSSLMETDFLNRNLRIHRRSHESVSADHGELLYRNDGFIEEVSTTSIEPLYAELEHFLQCVRGRETPAVDGLQASRALQLADLIEQCVEQPNLCMALEAPI